MLVPEIHSPAKAQTTAAEVPSSLFHTSWWLDAATKGRWEKSEVLKNGKVVASWPYLVKRRYGMCVSTQPILTRSLGPVITPGKGRRLAEFRREAELVRELVSQMPAVQYFNHALDPASGLGVHFRTLGYTCELEYTIRTVAGQATDTLWNEMRDKTRNLIRGAMQAGLSVRDIPDPDEFCDFYAQRLKIRGVRNVYRDETMRRICRAAIEHGAGRAFGAYTPAGTLVAAIFTAWDETRSYFLLSCRMPEAHSGAVSLLIWRGMQEAAEAGRVFDFDGIATPSISRFLSGFCANVVPRVRIIRGGALVRGAYAAVERRAWKEMFGGDGATGARNEGAD